MVDGSLGGGGGGEEKDYHHKLGMSLKQQRKSVSHLQLMKSNTLVNAKENNANQSTTTTTNTEYWRPKMFRKTHKIKLQVHIICVCHKQLTYITHK